MLRILSIYPKLVLFTILLFIRIFVKWYISKKFLNLRLNHFFEYVIIN